MKVFKTGNLIYILAQLDDILTSRDMRSDVVEVVPYRNILWPASLPCFQHIRAGRYSSADDV